MNKLLFLCGIFICTSCFADNPHTKVLQIGNGVYIQSVCINTIEYIIVVPDLSNSGTAISLSVDKNGKPKQCTY
jgi:hypothetical protein